MTWTYQPCPLGCGKTHPLLALVSKRGPARPFDGPFVSPLRPVSREAAQEVMALTGPPTPARLREALNASPDSPESSRSKAAPAVMPGSRSPRPVTRALRVGG